MSPFKASNLWQFYLHSVPTHMVGAFDQSIIDWQGILMQILLVSGLKIVLFTSKHTVTNIMSVLLSKTVCLRNTKSCFHYSFLLTPSTKLQFLELQRKYARCIMKKDTFVDPSSSRGVYLRSFPLRYDCRLLSYLTRSAFRWQLRPMTNWWWMTWNPSCISGS